MGCSAEAAHLRHESGLLGPSYSWQIWRDGAAAPPAGAGDWVNQARALCTFRARAMGRNRRKNRSNASKTDKATPDPEPSRDKALKVGGTPRSPWEGLLLPRPESPRDLIRPRATSILLQAISRRPCGCTARSVPRQRWRCAGAVSPTSLAAGAGSRAGEPQDLVQPMCCQRRARHTRGGCLRLRRGAAPPALTPPRPRHAPQSLLNAVKDAERCISIAPEWAKGYFRKGVALRALGRGRDAQAAFRQVRCVPARG